MSELLFYSPQNLNIDLTWFIVHQVSIGDASLLLNCLTMLTPAFFL